MRAKLSILWVVGAMGLWACGGKPVDPKPLPPPPSIKSFQADKARLSLGESATLTFAAENVTAAELVDHTGQRIELSGTAGEGSAQVSPTETSYYVLRVSGEGGRASAFVQVAVDEDLQRVFLVAVPPAINAGESAQLIWNAFDAQAATIRVGSGGELPIDAAAQSGVVDVTPARSETYELVASGLDAAEEQRATAAIDVRPVLVSADLTPAAANVNETLTFTWNTLAASEVTVSERTFGELHKVAAPSAEEEVSSGTFAWKVPAATPSGAEVSVGFPLEFTLTVKQANPDVTLTRVFPSFVGNGPRITTLDIPSAVTENKPFQISWTTQNATRVQVLARGAVIYEPLPRDLVGVTRGSITLAAPQVETTYEVVAWGFAETSARETRTVKVVKPPLITAFEMPTATAAEADPAHATWKTANATSVTLSVKEGISVFSTSDPGQVADGAADVRPGASTTFLLEAWNDAGDRAVEERTVAVPNSSTFTAGPRPIVGGAVVTVNWSIDALNTSQVFGDPTQPLVKTNPALDFVDLSTHSGAKTLAFADGNDAISKIPVPPGFRTSIGGLVAREFWASTNGFIAFENVGARPQNDDLASPVATDLPSMVAPFWDDLVLGRAGKVLYVVEGTQFPRRLIVQWDQVQTAEDPDSVLTFQAQLYESGQVKLAWSTLTGNGSTGVNANIGWRADVLLNRDLVSSGIQIVADDQVVFFGDGSITGTYAATPERNAVFTLVTRRANGHYAIYPSRVSVIPRGSVLVNEAMVVPDPNAITGQWVELLNTTNEDIDLSGTTLQSSATATSYTLPEGTILPANDFLVLGQSVDPNLNGNAPVDLAWSDLLLAAQTDELSLRADGDLVSSLQFLAASIVAGQSLQPPENAIDSAGYTLPCARTRTFGGDGALGTPGAENEACFDYTLREIALNFRDISDGSGKPLFPPGSRNQQTYWTSVPLGLNKTFKYFGEEFGAINVSATGFLGFKSLASTYATNDVRPDADPAGVIAPFWDNLNNDNSGLGQVFVRRMEAGDDPDAPAGHWIIQWSHYTYQPTPIPGDDLNFEAKLFDSGVIEFHYALMSDGHPTLNFADGTSATVWISNPAGNAALPIGINQPVISAMSAYRFTPKP